MRLIRDAKHVTSGAMVGVLLTSLRSILVLRILDPAEIGAWKAAMALYITGEIARLGILRGMAMQIPILAGKGEHEEQDRLARTASSFVLLVGVVLAAGIFLFGLTVADRNLRLALTLTAVVLLLAQPHNFLRDLASGRHLFDVRGKEMLIASVTDFAAALALSHWFGLAGLGSATILSVLAPTIYLWRRQRFQWGIHLDLPRLKKMARIGTPYSLLEAAFDLVRFLDVLVMTPILGPILVGRYAVSLLINDFANFLTKLGVSQVVAPHMLREFGRVGSASGVATYYETPVRLFCYVLPPVLAVGALLVPAFVQMALPQYVQGIAAAQVTVWTVLFMAIHSTISPFFVAANKVWAMLRIFACFIPAGALAQYVVMRAGFGLPGVAWTSFALMGAVTAAEMYVARRSCGHGRLQTVLFIGLLSVPLAASMILTRLIESVGLGPSVPEIAGLLLRVLLILVCYTPILALYEGRMSILRAARQTV